jgi:quercetin dioxygenase-like cupin family protein
LKPLLCSLLLLFAFSPGAQAPVAVPIPKEPHHHLVLENSYVRVFRVSIPAHDATLLHQHDVPYIYVALGPADVINAVQGKPEAHLVMADGQVGYSRGGFAHIARTDAGSSFNNVTIELLHPQGESHNLCEKIISGPLNDCMNSDANKLPSDSPLAALAREIGMKRLFETNEIQLKSFSIAPRENYSESSPQPARLLIVEGNSELQVDLPGEPSKSLRSGEVLWLDAGKKWTIITAGEKKLTRFLLLQFKDSATNARN